MDDQNDQEIDPSKQKAEEECFEFESKKPRTISITDDELRAIKEEALTYKDKYLRLLAETENTKKRVQKEREETTRYAIESIAVDFLHPLDNLENALQFAKEMSEEVKNWAIGFQMILNQFKDALTDNGISPFPSKGNPFDPHLHEAIEAVDSDEAPGTVVEECIKGYKMGDRVIRPARVKVAKSK